MTTPPLHGQRQELMIQPAHPAIRHGDGRHVPRLAAHLQRCAQLRPPLVAPVPEAHPDACHLPWEKKVELGGQRAVTAILGEDAA